MNSHCGFVAIVGRPNVGKSTLLNHLLGQKVSITSRKPQTTRHRLVGVKTLKNQNTQILYIDTPGLHQKTLHRLNHYMNATAKQAINEVDVIVFMVQALKWTSDDEWVLKQLQNTKIPVILVINKVDQIKDKPALLPYIEQIKNKFSFLDIIPVSALRGEHIDKLEKIIAQKMPPSPFYFPEDHITDKSESFIAAEVIREKIIRQLGEELPYATTVTIQSWEQKEKILAIAAVIWVERPGQKIIVIGEKGTRLKKIGTQARQDLEKFFQQKIFLQLWVKVKENWSDQETALRELGYDRE